MNTHLVDELGGGGRILALFVGHAVFMEAVNMCWRMHANGRSYHLEGEYAVALERRCLSFGRRVCSARTHLSGCAYHTAGVCAASRSGRASHLAGECVVLGRLSGRACHLACT